MDEWRSQTGAQNAIDLRKRFAAGSDAIAEYDRLGHLLLFRAGSRSGSSGIEELVGVAILRRAVTIFTAMRTLFEASLPDPARALARAYFELWLQYRCLAYGSAAQISLETKTLATDREARARRYYVAAERRSLRSRALMLDPKAEFKPNSDDTRDNLRQELQDQIDHLRKYFPDEWKYFGDVDEKSVSKHVSGRDEPSWFSAEFSAKPVKSVSNLAEAFGFKWEYDFLYDAFSALVHSRGTGQDITVEQGELAIHHPHDPTWFEMLATFLMHWHGLTLMTAAKWHATDMIEQVQQLHLRHRDGINSLRPQDVPHMLA